MTTTLWDLLENWLRPRPPERPRQQAKPPQRARRGERVTAFKDPEGRGFPTRIAPQPPTAPQPTRESPARPPLPTSDVSLPASMEARYDAVTRLMLERYSIRVRKWRTSMSGLAWCLTYRDGSVKRLIEAPRPRGPMSAAVFLHEIGHHAIGFETYRPRCLEELHAWRFALDEMDEWGIVVTRGVRKRVHESLAYAVSKALRRGIKCVPPELEPFAQGRVAPGCWIDPRASVASGPS